MTAPLGAVAPGVRRSSGPATRPWVHLEATPLFDQANGTKGVGATEEADDAGRNDTLKLIELGAASSIITFGGGLGG
jgi:hypothetical protein